jgi:alpha-glucan,water dikinase
LRAKAVAERIARALSAWIDRFYHLLQPKAEYLGRGFQAEPWTVTLFSEEVVRGSSLGFALSMLLRHLDPLLRQSAQLGDWQVISRGRGAGLIEVVNSLRSLQGRQFDSPRVIVADKVLGDEEIPEGVTAVISPDTTDVVSHVAVRARNANILFVSCYDAATLDRLKSMQGQAVQLEVNPAGDVVIAETAAVAPAPAPAPTRSQPTIRARPFSKYALAAGEFNDQVVGSKALHLAGLRDRVPDWIHVPVSVAVPFGVCEKVLALEPNRAAARRCRDLITQAESGKTEALAGLRETVQSLTMPPELIGALRETVAAAGLAWPDHDEKVLERIKQVWASKWNDRAFMSRKIRGIPHENLVMAVLIQQVIPTDYAFVIHTVNPATNNANELFAEVVLGLGETLVGNHPGRALGFVWDKTTGKTTLRSYPSKSLGLYGGGLIFRSDSNGEDLSGYAGAGLYDSVALEPPRAALLDYTQEPLVWDEGFREDLLATIARVGLDLERLCQAPQDVEGVVAQGNYHVVQTRPQVGIGSESFALKTG